jgi:hypothetical protein
MYMIALGLIMISYHDKSSAQPSSHLLLTLAYRACNLIQPQLFQGWHIDDCFSQNTHQRENRWYKRF